MRKFNGFMLLSIIVLSCFLSSCTTVPKEVISPTREEVNANLICEKIFRDDSDGNNNEIFIKYPEFNQMGMQQINQDIYQFVTDIPNLIYGEGYSNIQLQIRYEIKLLNSQYISVIFSGMGESGAAYPQNIFLTRNYDLEQKIAFGFSELYCLDMDFSQKIYESVEKQINKDVFDVFKADYENSEILFQLISSCDAHIDDCQSYLTPNGIGMCIPIRHVGGDYVLIEFDSNEIELNGNGNQGTVSVKVYHTNGDRVIKSAIQMGGVVAGIGIGAIATAVAGPTVAGVAAFYWNSYCRRYHNRSSFSISYK